MKIYALKWKQTGKISAREAYLTREQAQRNADHNNKQLNPNHLQRLLGRYWEVAVINVKEEPTPTQYREDDDVYNCSLSDMRRGGF